MVLPPNWEETATEDGTVYYYNSVTGETSWDPPIDTSTVQSKPPTIALSTTEDGLPPNWIECTDDEGYVYYFNTATQESSWDRPKSTSKPNTASTKHGSLRKSVDGAQAQGGSRFSKRVSNFLGAMKEAGEKLTKSKDTPEEKQDIKVDISWPDSYATGQVKKGPQINIPPSLLPKRASSQNPSKDGNTKESESKAEFSRVRTRSFSCGSSFAAFCPRCEAVAIAIQCTSCKATFAFDPVKNPDSEKLEVGPKGKKYMPLAPPRSVPDKKLPALPSLPPTPTKSTKPAVPAPKASLPPQPKPTPKATPTATPTPKPTTTSKPPTSKTVLESSPSVESKDIGPYMRQCGVSGAVIQILQSQGVTLQNMNSLTQDALKDFGVSAWGDRTSVLNAVKGWENKEQVNREVRKSTFNNGVFLSPPQDEPEVVKAPRSPVTRGPPPPAPVAAPAPTRTITQVPTPTPAPAPAPTPAPTTVASGWAVPKVPASTTWGASPELLEKQKQQEEKKKEDAKKREEERKKRAKEMAQKEEEYVRTKGTSQQLQQVRQRKEMEAYLQATVNPATCPAEFRVASFEIKSKGRKQEFVLYQVEIQYDLVTWTIFRRFGQFTQLDNAFRREVPGYTPCLPQKDKSQKIDKFNAAFLKDRQQKLDDYVQIVCNSRPAIFSYPGPTAAYSRFFAPVQLGDKKGPDFVLPFKLIL